MEDLLGQRLFVSTPWEGSVIARLEEANRLSLQRLTQLEKRKDPEDQLRQMKAYRDTDDRLIEECVTNAVAAALDDSTIIVSSRYEYQGTTGDLDGLVIGRWKAKDVVVVVEAKHNMDSAYTKARKELLDSAAYWEQLVVVDPSLPEDVDTAIASDYVALQVADNKDRMVMFALGAIQFSDDTASRQFGNLRMPWLRVVPNSAGRFLAFFQPVRESQA